MKYRIRLIFFVLCLLIVTIFPPFCLAAETTSDFPQIDSPAAILMNCNTGKILYEKNAYQRMYPASTTKIMTAILVLESGLPLTELATVSSNAINIPARICSCKPSCGRAIHASTTIGGIVDSFCQ